MSGEVRREVARVCACRSARRGGSVVSWRDGRSRRAADPTAAGTANGWPPLAVLFVLGHNTAHHIQTSKQLDKQTTG